MKQCLHELHINTLGQGLVAITRPIENWVSTQAISTGLLTVFLRHTSASLLIQENADPDVIRDLNDFFARIVPEDERIYRHNAEGPDDMPAHIRTALTQTHLAVPMHKGALTLGIWQGVYLFEHRRRPQSRTIVLHLMGET